MRTLRQPIHLRGRAALACTLLALVVTGCGGGDSEGGGGGGGILTRPLTSGQAKAALLSEANLGEGFSVTDDDDDDDTDLGCLGALDDLDRAKAPTRESIDYEASNEVGLPALSSAVSSYDKVSKASETFSTALEALEGCTEVEETDDEGTTTTLDVKVDGEKSTTAAQEQFNIAATGKISSEGLEFDFGLWATAVRIDNHVAFVSYGDLDAEAGAEAIDALAAAAAERLRAVIDGNDPSDDLIDFDNGPGPGSTSDDDGDLAESSESAEAGFEQLPLDGGTYTWESGITLKLTVERVEPWGSKSDFCGDGSCGIANPDDTRMTIRYDVTVPDDYPEPFDPSYSCPGDLHATTGSDGEALGGVFGDYTQDLGGKIFPGQSKFGVNEYYVEKAYVGDQFYIESTCGDEDSNESAYFVGPVKKTA